MQQSKPYIQHHVCSRSIVRVVHADVQQLSSAPTCHTLTGLKAATILPQLRRWEMARPPQQLQCEGPSFACYQVRRGRHTNDASMRVVETRDGKSQKPIRNDLPRPSFRGAPPSTPTAPKNECNAVYHMPNIVQRAMINVNANPTSPSAVNTSSPAPCTERTQPDTRQGRRPDDLL